jgi:hypothetical protein
MGETTERVVGAIRRLFESLSVNITEERVVRYMLDEIRKGRAFDSVLADPYVVNHSRDADRARLLENPQILRSIEDELESEFEDYRRATERAPEHTS